jgi:hypothetical protein
MNQQQEKPRAAEPGQQPDNSEAARWAEFQFTDSPERARARVEEIAGREAAEKNGQRAAPKVIDAAVRTLVLGHADRGVYVRTGHATVWDIDAVMVAVYQQEPGGPVTGADCTCARSGGPCAHLLIALAGMPDPESDIEHDDEGITASEDLDAALTEQFPKLTPAERDLTVNMVLRDAATQIRNGN